MSSPLTWLHGLRIHCRLPVTLSIVLATLGGFLAIVQAALLAHVLHGAVIEHHTREQLLPYFAWLVTVLLLRAFLSWGREVCGQRASTMVRRYVRKTLIEELTAGGPLQVQARGAAPLASSIIERVEALHGYFAHYLPQKGVAATVPVIIILTSFFFSWAVGLIFLITAPLIPAMMMMIGRGAEKISQKNFQLLSRMSAHFLDTLKGLPTLKLFMRSKQEAERIAASSEQYRKGTMGVLRVAFLSSAVLEFFTSVAIAMTAVYLGLTYLNYLDFGLYGRELDLRTGLLLLLLAPDVYLPLRDLGTHFHARADALGAADELHSLLENLGKDKPQASPAPLIKDNDGIALEFREVHYHYSDRNRPALNHFSLSIRAGEWLAIVGSSGAGKTSLLNLLLGFLPIQHGEIYINNSACKNLDSDSWRRRVGWVPQHPQLFYGTLEDNIDLGKRGYSREKLQRAAKEAHLLGQLPEGLTTDVGEQGNRLSGGQARRVALARAFAKNAPLLLLDEPTAGLDLENERLIMESIERLRRGKTVIMLTHRLDTAIRADRIAVMEAGVIVEEGHHEQLMAQGGVYSDLVKSRRMLI